MTAFCSTSIGERPGNLINVIALAVFGVHEGACTLWPCSAGSAGLYLDIRTSLHRTGTRYIFVLYQLQLILALHLWEHIVSAHSIYSCLLSRLEVDHALLPRDGVGVLASLLCTPF